MPTSIDTGVLYNNDNLDQLASLPDASVDLVYLDPPFFSNRIYEVIWGEEAEVRSFEDRWEGGMLHYIGWMSERLTQLHRVLKPNASLYLHCDPHASHYLKVCLDEIFGQQRFVNEVIWKRTSAHNRLVRYGPVHDVILVYAKSDKWYWQEQHVPYDPAYVEQFYRHVDEESGRVYRLDNATSNRPGGRYAWKGQPPPGNRFWGYSEATMERFEEEGRLVYSKNGIPSYKRYLDEMPGQLLQDVWTDIKPLGSRSLERRGYPTQKPEMLMERIITASCPPGGIVLDPFCGCGTTIAVAERLNRQWIGIDISNTAMEVMRRRLWNQSKVIPIVVGAPDDEESLKTLKPFEFQNWIINAMHGSHSPRKVHDMGIDGYSFFTKDPIQVKQSSGVGRNVVDNFETAMRRGHHDTGYIVAFSFTKGAVEEVARARADGLNIKLVKVKEVLLLKKRPGNPLAKFGPQPEGDVLPLPPIRKPADLPTVEELIASDLAAAR